jgi:hypothetical protein
VTSRGGGSLRTLFSVEKSADFESFLANFARFFVFFVRFRGVFARFRALSQGAVSRESGDVTESRSSGYLAADGSSGLPICSP